MGWVRVNILVGVMIMMHLVSTAAGSLFSQAPAGTRRITRPIAVAYVITQSAQNTNRRRVTGTASNRWWQWRSGSKQSEASRPVAE